MKTSTQVASKRATHCETVNRAGVSRRSFLAVAQGFAVAPGLAAGTSWAQVTAGASPASTEAAAPPMPPAGTPLRLPAVQLFDGTIFQPPTADGHLLVVYWWSSTCPFCALQSPEMQKLWRAYQDRGLQMLTLSVDRTQQDAVAYLQKKGYTFPAGFVTPEVQRVMPKPRGLPITLVRGRDGRVLQAEKGQMFPEEIEQLARWL